VRTRSTPGSRRIAAASSTVSFRTLPAIEFGMPAVVVLPGLIFSTFTSRSDASRSRSRWNRPLDVVDLRAVGTRKGSRTWWPGPAAGLRKDAHWAKNTGTVPAVWIAVDIPLP